MAHSYRKVKVGLSVRSPIGDGCSFRFEGIEIKDKNYKDIS